MEDQQMEIEGLQFVFADEMEVLSEEPPLRISVNLAASNAEPGESKVKLIVEFPDDYPDVSLPIFEIESLGSLSDAQCTQLQVAVTETAEENQGTAMVFALCTRVQEWLEEEKDRLVREEEEAKNRKQELEANPDSEELARLEEMRKYGTPVTRESFLAWKEKFDAERLSNVKVSDEILPPTGKQMFELDATLAMLEQEELELDD